MKLKTLYATGIIYLVRCWIGKICSVRFCELYNFLNYFLYHFRMAWVPKVMTTIVLEQFGSWDQGLKLAAKFYRDEVIVLTVHDKSW